MYEAFFNLKRKPFELLPNPDFLYPSKSHKKVLTYLDYGIRERSGFILLTGEVGTGKTTIIREIIKKHLSNVLLARIFHTKVESLQLLAMVNEELGLSTADKDKPTLLRELHDFLIEQYAKKRPVVLIIDEAQNLTRDILEEVRMLSNLETEDKKLLHIILVGQPELRRVLSSPELLQLRQRIQINCHIEPISEAETGDYILYRLEAAGNRDALAFAPECFPIISSYTKGIPRLINILCDYILLDAFANEAREVNGEAIHEIARDISFTAQYWESTPQEEAPDEEPPHKAGGKGRGQERPRHSNNKLQDVLVGLNRRLQNLETAFSKQNNPGGDGLKESLNALTSRMEDLWKTMDQIKSQAQDARPAAPVAVPADRPSLAEIASGVAENPLRPHDAKQTQQPWLKRLLYGGS